MRKRCCCGSQGQGGDLVAAAAALSIVMAQGKTAEEIELLSAIFDMLADNLATLALKAPSEEDCRCPEKVPCQTEHQNEDRCS